MRRLLRYLSFLSLLLVALVALTWWLSLPERPGAFYSYRGEPPEKHGELLKIEPMSRKVPQGARGWRMLYSTTRPDGSPAIASAIVVAPLPSGRPFPLIAYAHGTSGIRPGCAPSMFADPFPNVPGYPRLLQEGWAYVATDYSGLGTEGRHFYLVGEDEARAVLDSINAARKIPGLALSGQTVVWGHSQGGHAALWAGMIAPRYAPAVPLAGVAAVAPASDLAKLIEAARSSKFGEIISAYVVAGYDWAYPQAGTWSYVEGWLRALASDMSRRCIEPRALIASLIEARMIPQGGLFATSPSAGEFGRRLDENTPRGPYAMPVLIAQGRDDPLILPSIQDGFVKRLCDNGQTVDYQSYPGEDHISIVQPGSPLIPRLIEWTTARLRGVAATSTCAN